MKNCPDEFYNQCANAQKKCKVCAAGTASNSSKVFYQSLTGDNSSHPYKPDQQKQKRLRQAKQVEQKQLQTIAKATLRSGAALGNGDGELLSGSLRLETKDRGVRRSWNLTLPEYEKGQRQGIDIYGITITHPVTGKNITMYMIEERLAGYLLALIQKEQTEDLTSGNKEDCRR